MKKLTVVLIAAAAAAVLAGCSAREARGIAAKTGEIAAKTGEGAKAAGQVIQAFRASSTDKEEKERTVTVSATGTVNVAPDMARITMGVVTEEKTAEEAQRKSAETVNAVTEKLKELGVEEKSVQTSGFNMYQQYDYENNRVKGYRVEVLLTVGDRKVEETGRVIAACTESGANQFHGISMSSSRYDEAYEQALGAAVAEARAKAEAIAQASGSTLGPALSVTEGYQDTSARWRGANVYAEEAMVQKAAADMAVMPGEVPVGAPVTVTFLLED